MHRISRTVSSAGSHRSVQRPNPQPFTSECGRFSGNIRKPCEVNGVLPVVHVRLKHEVVPILSRWTILHVARIIAHTGRLGQRPLEIRQPLARPRLQHYVRRREEDVLRAAGEWRRQYAGIPQPPFSPP
jgi:hypothetical protein